jgi:hypothetical protein
MQNFRPRLTRDEIFDVRTALGIAIESITEQIDSALSVQEVDVYCGQIQSYCDLYVKFRQLNGYGAAGRQRVAQFLALRDAAARRWQVKHPG